MITPFDPSGQFRVSYGIRFIELEIQTTILALDPHQSSSSKHKDLFTPVLLGQYIQRHLITQNQLAKHPYVRQVPIAVPPSYFSIVLTHSWARTENPVLLRKAAFTGDQLLNC